MVKSPVVLAVLDGFGEHHEAAHNAIANASTPVIDSLKKQFPHGLIDASGLAVGLPPGQMGNSEVGHMNIGSGRIIMQDLPRIDQAIADRTLASDGILLEFIQTLKANTGVCHLLGLLSDGGVHSHQDHIGALAEILQQHGIKTYIHAFLDGRDTPPQSALEHIAAFDKKWPQAAFATASGRYYAMDRDKRWDRVSLAYKAMVSATGKHFTTIQDAVASSYSDGKKDEFVLPAIIGNYPGMQAGDGLLMANFRADRAREILHALLEPAFAGFEREKVIPFCAALGVTEYSQELNQYIGTIFQPEKLKNILGEVLEQQEKTQLHIAETEKYAHVTFFFNGGREEVFKGEERILIPSPRVATYDLQPEMSAFAVTEALVEAIKRGAFDFIVVNYANCDMVGHTGSMEAATRAVEAVDKAIGQVWEEVRIQGGTLIITADHGNAEKMYDEETRQPHTAHTVNFVPVIIAGEALKGKKLTHERGVLADIAPTVLKLMKIERPIEMTGKNLL